MLRHGQYQNFWVNGTAWTFSSTICVDWGNDESRDLLHLPRVRIMEAQGARDLPPAIQYLSVHCDISPLVLSSCSKEVTKVPVLGFLQIATTSWNSMWECWLPDFQWRPVRGGLVLQSGRRKSRGRDTAWRISRGRDTHGSCENCLTREKVLVKRSGKSSFSEYLGFESDALEFPICYMLGQTCGIQWWKKKRRLRGRIHEAWREFSCFRNRLPVCI